jgi:conjugal transfer pilin signal peptidase TrbI
MLIRRLIPLAFLGLAPFGTLCLFSEYYTIGVNLTDSLPEQIYLISKDKMPRTRDDYISFHAPNNKLHKEPFLKLVGGIEGDIVEEKSRNFYINGVPIGYAKEYSKTGEKIELGFTGVIPKGCYFVYSNHKDSYDSKYKDIGLVCRADVIGTALPIF